jgi:Cu/Ag efflux pump CusA
MVVALTVTPTLGLLLLSKTPRPRRQPPLLPALAASYDRVLSRLVRTPRTLLLAVAAIAIAGVALLPLLGEAFRPSFKDRELLVHFDATPSTSLGEMDRITSRAASELRSVPGVSKVGAHLGRAVSGDQTVGTGSAELWVSLDASAGYDTSLASIRDVVDGYPGLRGRVLTYENERSQGVFAPADNGLTVRVYGQELGVLHRKADELRAILAHVDGVRDPRVLTPTVQPTLEVEADIAAARRHGIKPGDVRRAVATLVSGLEVGNFFEQQKVFSVVVRGTPATTHSVDSVRALLLDSPNGGHARLGDVAHVRIKPNPVDIRHDAVSRYMDVRAGVAGRDLGSVRRDVQRRLRQLAFPLEYHAELLGTPPDERSGQSFLAVAIASAIGVFLLLQAAFGSWRLAALVFAGLPVALAGGLLVAFAGGGKLALGEAAGLFAVLALAARNGIALVMRVQALQEEGLRRPGLVRRAARERFAPATATAALVALAFLPPALLGDVAGNEITHSMALVVLGGLVTSTLLALVVAPGLLLHYGGPGIASEPPARTRASRVPPPSISPT